MPCQGLWDSSPDIVCIYSVQHRQSINTLIHNQFKDELVGLLDLTLFRIITKHTYHRSTVSEYHGSISVPISRTSFFSCFYIKSHISCLNPFYLPIFPDSLLSFTNISLSLIFQINFISVCLLSQILCLSLLSKIISSYFPTSPLPQPNSLRN